MPSGWEGSQPSGVELVPVDAETDRKPLVGPMPSAVRAGVNERGDRGEVDVDLASQICFR